MPFPRSKLIKNRWITPQEILREEFSEIYFSEQIKLLYNTSALVGISTTLINSILIFFSIRNYVNPFHLNLWMAGVVCLSIIRYIMYIIYKHYNKIHRPDQSPIWFLVFISGLFLSGCFWGGSVFFIFPENSYPHQSLFILVLGGMIAGSTVAYSLVPVVFFSFVIPAFIPLLVKLYFFDDELHFMMGTFSAVYFIMMLAMGRQLWQNTNRSLRLKFEHLNLAQKLNQSLNEIEKTNMELRISNEKVAATTKLKDKFLSYVAHDLRSPLSALLNNLFILETSFDETNPEKKAIYSKLVSITENMSAITDELLNVSRFQSGDIKLNLLPVKIHPLITSVIDTLVYSAKLKGISFHNKIPEDMILSVDSSLFRAVIQNLLSNALKFCRSGDWIDIYSDCEIGNTIVVHDSGVGIEESFISNLFSYEIRTSSAGTSGEKGTGFGLPFCKEIVNRHGGELFVTTEKNRGTSFFIKLPKNLICSGSETKYSENIPV